MPRNACINHPGKDVIKVEEGMLFCNRCRYLFKYVDKETVTVEVITPPVAEVPLEPELTEQTEAVEDAVEETLEAIIEEVGPLDISPEEMDVEAESEMLIMPTIITDKIQEQPEETPLEAEIEVVQPEVVVEVPEGATVTTSTEEPSEAKPKPSERDAKIEALKAQLAELEPEAE